MGIYITSQANKRFLLWLSLLIKPGSLKIKEVGKKKTIPKATNTFLSLSISLCSMDLQLKQWRSQQQNESEEQVSATKISNFFFDQIQSQTATSAAALPLFVPEPTSSSSFSCFSSDSSSSSSRFLSKCSPDFWLFHSNVFKLLLISSSGFCLFLLLLRDGKLLQLRTVARTWATSTDLQIHVGWCFSSSRAPLTHQEKSLPPVPFALPSPSSST